MAIMAKKAEENEEVEQHKRKILTTTDDNLQVLPLRLFCPFPLTWIPFADWRLLFLLLLLAFSRLLVRANSWARRISSPKEIRLGRFRIRSRKSESLSKRKRG